MKTADITIDALRERFSYEPDTGRILVAKAMIGRGIVGREAGYVAQNGYRYVGFKRKHLLSSRLAWALFYGQWPRQEIDHIDGDPLNNRIANLRDVSSGAQKRNRPVRGRTGVKSVCFHQKGYRARLTVNRKTVDIGYFRDLREAEHAVIAKEKELGIYEYRRSA